MKRFMRNLGEGKLPDSAEVTQETEAIIGRKPLTLAQFIAKHTDRIVARQ